MELDRLSINYVIEEISNNFAAIRDVLAVVGKELWAEI